MDVESTFATMIIADIVGSTPLYKAVGDDEAQRLIQLEIDRLRSVLQEFGGIPVGQKGDDVLSYFENPSAAYNAALKLIEPSTHTPLSVHVGVHCGPIVIGKRGIYGEAVNVTARFATAANPGEACFSQGIAVLLPADLRRTLTPLGQLSLKGLTEPQTAYSLIHPESDSISQTRLPQSFGRTEENWQPREGLTLILRHEDRVWRCLGNGEFKIGRAPDCDVVLPQPWISRLHAVLAMKAGKLILTDRSTSGTYVKSESGREIQLKRESVMLADSGLISPTLPIDMSETCLQFELLGRNQVPQNVA
ncbi:adenylate/guanylate cyclase domain-containing protein [Ruegeria sp. R13_0]|uniref:adenylate/guanylate cyclase domain-containing protein n=1 Tax=Ruegeria TaxID=97050 RepID=UPI0014803198|nr:adenylate/guanylate cyclase domain-containing protein [Ruegeria sp. R13_0]MBO9435307.1 adenylate/guanylate cyclase domain-containing protein [Ruegeria sp. R13_0]